MYFLGVMTAKFYSIIRFQPINFCMHIDTDIGRSSPFFIPQVSSLCVAQIRLDEEMLTTIPCKYILREFMTRGIVCNIQILQQSRISGGKKSLH